MFSLVTVLTLSAAVCAQDAPRPPEDTTPPPATPRVMKPVTRENIQEAISRGVETILATQQADGSF
ncbi:MAG TPA: hypothetical protein VMX57_00120, partial [Planctomycetota bacterium]|nr:hypothetical protein [Planctomycetota bacterium]